MIAHFVTAPFACKPWLHYFVSANKTIASVQYVIDSLDFIASCSEPQNPLSFFGNVSAQ